MPVVTLLEIGVHASGIQNPRGIKAPFQTFMDLVQISGQGMEDHDIRGLVPKPGGMPAGCTNGTPDYFGFFRTD